MKVFASLLLFLLSFQTQGQAVANTGAGTTSGGSTSQVGQAGFVLGPGTKDLDTVISEWRNANPLVHEKLLELENMVNPTGGPLTASQSVFITDPFILMLRSESAIFDFVKFYAWTGSAHAVSYISSLANGNPVAYYGTDDPRRQLVRTQFQRVSNSAYVQALFGFALYSHESLSDLSTIKCIGAPLAASSQVNPSIKRNTIDCVEMYGAEFSNTFDRYLLASKVDFNLSAAENAIENYNPLGLPSGMVDDVGELKKRIYSYGAFILANAEDSLTDPSTLTSAVANGDNKLFNFLKDDFGTLMEAVDGEEVQDPEYAMLAKQNGLQDKVLDVLQTNFVAPVATSGEASGESDNP